MLILCILCSVVWTQVFKQEHSTGMDLRRSSSLLSPRLERDMDLRRFDFPHISSIFTPSSDSASTSGRRDATATPSQTQSFLNDVWNSYSRTAPLITRLIATNNLLKPQFSVTLQRDSVDPGGNVGILSIGALPEGVKEDSITWAPVRKYGLDEGGLPPPPGSQEVSYLLIFLNGLTLTAVHRNIL